MMSKAERETLERLTEERDGARLEIIRLKASHATEVEELKKAVENGKSTSEMWMRSSQKAEQELESAHSLLDGLPQAPAAETEGKESYQRKQIPLTTRLASWIAKVAFSEAFAKIGIK
jgi:hypothetical protein